MWLLFGSCCSASGQRPSRERARHGSEVSESAPQPGRTENLQAAEPSGLFGYGTASRAARAAWACPVPRFSSAIKS